MTNDPVRLPTSKLALTLAGVCRQDGAPWALEERDGWCWASWDGLAGGRGHVGVRADDAEALAALARARSEPRAYVECWALLVRLVALDGKAGGWCLERAAELLYGPRGPSSHRERQLAGLRGWVALFERGWWVLDGRLAPSAAPPRPGRGGDRSAYGGAVEGGPLLAVEGTGRRRRTARLAPALRDPLVRGPGVLVPAATFRLAQAGHRNPEGNTASLATRARVRIAAALAGRWRQAKAQRVRLVELLESWAGVDLGPLRRRRREAAWFDALVADLEAAGAAGGVGLDGRPRPERAALATLVRLLVPSSRRREEGGPPAPPGGGAPARGGGPSPRPPSRAPAFAAP